MSQLVKRQPGVQQRAENHVAGGARETIEVEELHRVNSIICHGG